MNEHYRIDNESQIKLSNVSRACFLGNVHERKFNDGGHYHPLSENDVDASLCFSLFLEAGSFCLIFSDPDQTLANVFARQEPYQNRWNVLEPVNNVLAHLELATFDPIPQVDECPLAPTVSLKV